MQQAYDVCELQCISSHDMWYLHMAKPVQNAPLKCSKYHCNVHVYFYLSYIYKVKELMNRWEENFHETRTTRIVLEIGCWVVLK